PQIISEIARTQSVLRPLIGVSPRWLQPPYGDVDPRVTSVATSLGLRTIMWTINSGDQDGAGTKTMVANVMSHAANGSIILFHDEPGNEQATLNALKALVPALKY